MFDLTPENAGYIAGALSFVIGYGWYIISILKGQTKTHLLSWIILTLVSGITLVTYKGSGAEETIWIPVSNLVFSLIVMVLTLAIYLKKRRGLLAQSTFYFREKLAFGLAVIALAIYLFSHTASLAFILVLFAEILALTLILQQTIRQPGEESVIAWFGTSLANLFNWFAITQNVEYVYVLATGVMDFAILVFAAKGYLACRWQGKRLEEY